MMDTLFELQVDAKCDGTINWEKYLDYMFSQYSGKEKRNFHTKICPFSVSNKPVNDLGHYQHYWDCLVSIIFAPRVKKCERVFKPLDCDTYPGK